MEYWDMESFGVAVLKMNSQQGCHGSEISRTYGSGNLSRRQRSISSRGTS